MSASPRLHLARLWHQHQPVYRDAAHPTPLGSYRQPWVRLHALRDYYAMAALVAEPLRAAPDDQPDAGAALAARGLP